MSRFTEISIESLSTPPRQNKCYWEHPLGVRVTPKGTKSYIVIGPTGERKTIARVGVISLKEARLEALRIKAAFQPTKYKAPPITLAQARERYLAAIEVRAPTRKYYALYLAKLPDMPLQDVDHNDILRVLDEAPRGSAGLHLRTFSAFFNWCIPRYLKHSPCTGLKTHKITSRTRVLSDHELKLIWDACEQNAGLTQRGDSPAGQTLFLRPSALPISFCRIVQLLMVTGLRRTECSLIEKSWINEKEKTLTIPASVTKNAREHQIPLGSLSTTLISASLTMLATRSTFIFPAHQKTDEPCTNWSKPKAALDKASGVTDWVLHTLRHTYRSNLARLRCPPHIAERLVNHVSSRSVLEQIYDHHTYADEMREWQQKYEAWFTQLLENKPTTR